MGDISAEPSMEEILSSIKRIIAEEDTPAARRRPRPVPAAPPQPDEEVLELSDPMPPAATPPARVEQSAPEPVRAEAPRPDPLPVSQPVSQTDQIVSPAAMDATRGALESLSRLMVKPEPQSDGTLEGMVRDMLRPMLREWLDAHLPEMVEAMVSREIARISGQSR